MAFLQLNAPHITAGLQPFGVQHRALVIQQQQTDGPLKHHKTFKALAGVGAQMAMGTHIGAGLQHIQKALHQVWGAVQIVVQAPAWTTEGPGSNRIEEGLVQAAQRRRCRQRGGILKR